MALFVLHPWIRFGAGLLAGCWIGVPLGIAVAVLLVGRRMRQLEAANELLRGKLRTREKAWQPGGGPTLVTAPGAARPATVRLRAVGGR